MPSDESEPRSKKLAKLTEQEDAAWVSYFAWYCNNGWGDDEADKLAWADLQKEFPRLKDFAGAEA